MVDFVRSTPKAIQTLSIFKWKPSCEFDESLYSKKKSEFAQLVTIFTEAKNKRKEWKSAEVAETIETNALEKIATIFPRMGH